MVYNITGEAAESKYDFFNFAGKSCVIFEEMKP